MFRKSHWTILPGFNLFHLSAVSTDRIGTAQNAVKTLEQNFFKIFVIFKENNTQPTHKTPTTQFQKKIKTMASLVKMFGSRHFTFKCCLSFL